MYATRELRYSDASFGQVVQLFQKRKTPTALLNSVHVNNPTTLSHPLASRFAAANRNFMYANEPKNTSNSLLIRALAFRQAEKLQFSELNRLK